MPVDFTLKEQTDEEIQKEIDDMKKGFFRNQTSNVTESNVISPDQVYQEEAERQRAKLEFK